MSRQTSISIANAFTSVARDQANKGDLVGAIESMRVIECCADLPMGYRQDAREIMDLLLVDYFNQQRVRP